MRKWKDMPWVVRFGATIIGLLVILAVLFLIAMGVLAALKGISYSQAFDLLTDVVRNKQVLSATLYPLI